MKSDVKIRPHQTKKSGASRLRLIWKDPSTGRYHNVGWFTYTDDGQYRFQYSPHLPDSFELLVQFPDTSKTYESKNLPAFFANRVMSRRRASYASYVSWLGLDTEALPVELLARTGGGRATDTFHLVASFGQGDGVSSGRFFVSGIQHVPNGAELVSVLSEGDQLTLVDEPENQYNPRAILVTHSDERLGWVPDWLVNDVHELRSHGDVQVQVEQINTEAPARLRVLCKLEFRSNRSDSLEHGC